MSHTTNKPYHQPPSAEEWLSQLLPIPRNQYNDPEAERRDFQATFSGEATSVQAQRVLWRILEWCRIFAPIATAGDPYMTYFHDGERNIGLHLLARVGPLAESMKSIESYNEAGQSFQLPQQD